MASAVRVLGKNKFLASVKFLSSIKFPNLYQSFLKEVMKYVLREATIRVPVDTGLLRASGRSKITYTDKNGSSGVVSYHAPYAIYVHENLLNRHPVGESKFLENAIRAITPLFSGVLHKKISSVLRRRVMRDARAERTGS